MSENELAGSSLMMLVQETRLDAGATLIERVHDFQHPEIKILLGFLDTS